MEFYLGKDCLGWGITQQTYQTLRRCQRKTFSVLKNDYKYSLTILVETQGAVNDGLLTYHYSDHFSKPSTSNILQEARY